MSAVSSEILKYFGSEENYQHFRNNYINTLQYNTQNSIVNWRQSSTSTVSTLSSVSRSTSCDVLSITTTVWPSPNGTMKDVRFNILNKDIRRIAPGSSSAITRKSKLIIEVEFDAAAYTDAEKSRSVISSMLVEERNIFMKKLNAVKHQRLVLESYASTVIQKNYRRYCVRKNFETIRERQLIYKELRAKVVKHIFENHGIDCRLGTYRRAYKAKLFKRVRTIQCMYRVYAAKQQLYRLRRIANDKIREQAAIKIQCMGRKRAAINSTKIIRGRKEAIKKSSAAIKIQTTIRTFVAKKKFSRNGMKIKAMAVVLIQKYVRGFRARHRVKKLRLAKMNEVTNHRIESIQRYIRIFLAKRRVLRRKIKLLHEKITKAVTKIQAWVRRLIVSEMIKRESKSCVSLPSNQSIASDNDSYSSISNNCLTLPVSIDIDKNQPTKSSIFTLAELGSLDELDKLYHDKSVLQMNIKGTSNDKGELTSDPYECDEAGNTVLTIAAAHGHIEIVRQCLRWGFDPNHRTNNGHTALHLAVINNHIQVMQYLLSLNSVTSITPIKQLNPIDDNDSAELLIAAVENSKSQGLGALTFLLKHGLKVDAASSNKNGMTAYLAAAQIGNIDAVKLILQYNPNPDYRDSKKQSLLHKACMSSIELVKALMGEDVEMDAIYESINLPSGDDIVVHVFPNQALKLKDITGKDCAAIAALYGQTEILRYVIAKSEGVSVNLSSPTARTALTVDDLDIQLLFKLAESNNVECLSYCFKNFKNLDPNLKDPESGMTLAMKAASSGSVEIIDLLMNMIGFGLDLGGKDKEDWNILHHAALCASTNMIVYLLSHPNAEECNISSSLLSQGNNTNDTPIHIAIDTAALSMNPLNPTTVQMRSSVIIRASKHVIELLDSGSSEVSKAIDMKNSSGLSCLQHACGLGQHDIILKLIEMNSNEASVDRQGNTCILRFLYSDFGSFASLTSHSKPNDKRTHMLITRISTGNQRISLSTKDIEVIIALVNADCPLYKYTKITPQKILSSSAIENKTLDSGDIIARGKFNEIIRQLPFYLQNYDCWRLALSCILFSKPLSDASASNDEVDNEGRDESLSEPLLALLESDSAAIVMWSKNTSLSLDMSRKLLANKISFIISEESCNKLQNAMFGGVTLVGWAAQLFNPYVLRVLHREGLSLRSPVDIKGNTALHILAQSPSKKDVGYRSIVRTLLSYHPDLIDVANKDGFTPDMLCAKYGNIHVYKVLFNEYHSNPYRALKGKYSGWLVAYAKRYEAKKAVGRKRLADDDLSFLENN